ncbi:hypothetical protein ACE41H_15415 [Paenibacillus enshidis]|uniref:Uncharacterized protein n=1 Tax=Paenibacillus enshidis TaxID=1458439 RepID=A0ABV5AVC4_9BACL
MYNTVKMDHNKSFLEQSEKHMMLIEGSEVTEGDLVGYLPGLRLGVKGHTREELISKAKELIKVMKEEGSTFYNDVEYINLTV